MSKKKKKSGLTVMITIIITLLLCGLLIYRTDKLRKEKDAIVDECNTVNEQLEVAKIDRQNITNEIKYRETNDYIEDQAREIFGLRDSEDTIFVPEDASGSED